MRLWIFLLIWMVSIQICYAQLSIDEIISRALSLVRPIFDTSAPMENPTHLKKHIEPSPDDLRDSSILGSHHATPIDDLPLCRGNSRICQFVSCSAENFKKDAAFGNLQLAAQVLGDRKLRQAVSSNPELIDGVCKEQGMDAEQCKLFSKGFQLIDRVLTTVEKPSSKEAKETVKNPLSDPIPVPIQRDQMIQNDDGDYMDYHPPAPVSSPGSKQYGSKTWSSRPANQVEIFQDHNNDMVLSVTPPPFMPMAPPIIPLWTFPTFPPFVPPSPPTAPPLAFPTVPSLILSPVKLFELDKGFFQTNKFAFAPLQKDLFARQKRETEDVVSRVKRADYYDDLHNDGATANKGETTTSSSVDEDYYGSLDDVKITPKPQPSSPLKDCVNLLG